MMKSAAIGLLLTSGLALGACAGSSGGGTVSAGGLGLHYDSAYNGEITDIPVRRIGNDDIFNREFQDRALVNALGYIEASNISRERIRRVIISVEGGDSDRNRRFSVGTSRQFGVWVGLHDCDSDIFFRGNSVGHIARPNDEAGCLAGGIS